MRSLHVNTEMTWRGGEQQVIYLLQGLIARGDEAHLVCQPESPLAEKAEALGIPCTKLKMHGEIDLLAAARLAEVLRRWKTEILHIHTPHAHTLALLAAPFGGRPRLVVSKRTDFSIYRHSFFGLNGVKYSHGIHRYLAISEAVRNVLIKDGLPAERICVIRSGVDPNRVLDGNGTDLLAELSIGADVPIVGNIAHMAGHKGQRTLIEAVPRVLEQVPRARFIIVGEGELEASLKGLSRSLGVEKEVLFPGFRPDIASFLSIFSVFVMPSHQEGLGTAVLDALANRLPVVATTAGGIPEMVTDGVNGLLVSPKDPLALADRIVALLSDLKRADALGAAGFRTVLRDFSVETMVEKTREIYEEVLDGKGR